MKKFFGTINRTSIIITGVVGFIAGVIAIIQFVPDLMREDVAGEWYVVFKVDKSAYKPFIGETHSQKVVLEQSNAKVEGSGEKWEYNGKFLPAEMHRRVEYSGTINGDELKATYKLFGEKRISIGIIIVKVLGNKMEGTFSGTAGESSGTVIGERIN